MVRSIDIAEQRRRRSQRDFALGNNPRGSWNRAGWTIAPSFFVLLAVTAGTGYAVWHNQYGSAASIAFLISAALVTLCIHEFGHALVAYWGGDKSVRSKGYLTLDVLKYADPVNSLIFPMLYLFLGGIPLPGGAVYINNFALKNRFWESLVSAAGVLFNALALVPLVYFYHADIGGSQAFWQVVSFLIYIEIAAIFLNLLPIPSFDGFGIVEPILPRVLTAWLDQRHQIMRLVPFIILLFPNPVIDKIWELTDRVRMEMNGKRPVTAALFGMMYRG